MLRLYFRAAVVQVSWIAAALSLPAYEHIRSKTVTFAGTVSSAMTNFLSPFRFKRSIFTVTGFAGVLVLFASCGNLKEKGYDTKAIAEEVDNRKIKRITQAQLDEISNEWGGKITRIAQKDLTDVLTIALKKYPIEQAAAYCQVTRLPKADSVSKWYKAALKRGSLRDLNNRAKLSDKESEVLDAYLYNAEQKLRQTPNVQRLADKYLLYTSPILIESPLCLRCHGEVGKDVSPADFQKLTSQYNLDNLTNRRQPDLIGMWSITFDKKEMIKKIDMKELKRK